MLKNEVISRYIINRPICIHFHLNFLGNFLRMQCLAAFVVRDAIVFYAIRNRFTTRREIFINRLLLFLQNF